jgi:hypothetical protein
LATENERKKNRRKCKSKKNLNVIATSFLGIRAI